MNKTVATIIFLSLLVGQNVLAIEDNITERLSGRILLQVESYGRAWYVEPMSETRFYLQDGNEAYYIMRTKGLGITNKDLAKIPTQIGQVRNAELVNRLKGRILLQVEERGEAWYINPVDGLRYYMKDGVAAYKLMRTMGLGISNEDLARIAMNTEQVVHDTTFDDVAYVSYDGLTFSNEYNAEQILPLASLSKLMTALVLLDLNPSWNSVVKISEEHINYPKTLVGEDATSEINLEAGDRLSIYDLWVAMLVASSNQATIALVDSSGLDRATFVKKMNEKTSQLGLVKTKFYEPTGLDAHNVTTAKEMAKLANTAFNQPKIAEAGQQAEYIISALKDDFTKKEIPVVDRNYSLQQFEVEVAKTGFLIEAQRTVALQKNGVTVVVLHALSMTQRNTSIKNIIETL